MDNKYWAKRALERLAESEKTGNAAIAKILPLYQQALISINREIESIYRNYAKNGIVDMSLLKKAMDSKTRAEFMRQMRKNAKELGLNLNDVYDPRYLSRLTRANALKHQIILQMMAIAPKEQKISSSAYAKIIKDAYESIQKDLKLQGASINFGTLNQRVTTEILNSKWVGGNYSSRIWNNLDEFAQELPTVLGSALSSGQSYQKTASLLRERFNVSKYNATRLVRTETNYFHNQAELQSYIDDGIEEYEYDAEIDSRTSSICRRLNGKKFKVKNATPGVNYPPMHGNCRSTTRAVPNSGKKPTEKQRTSRLTAGLTAVALIAQYLPIIINQLSE